jgi:hypothetical protein
MLMEPVARCAAGDGAGAEGLLVVAVVLLADNAQRLRGAQVGLDQMTCW